MKFTIIKKVFRTDGFELKPDVQDWVLSDLEHIARVIIRKTKKCPIISVNYMGVWHHNNAVKLQSKDYHKASRLGCYMRFEVVLEKKVPKASRRVNIDDILNQLVMEAI